MIKRFLALVVVLALFVPTTSLAAEENKYAFEHNDTQYVSEHDTRDVEAIGFIKQDTVVSPVSINTCVTWLLKKDSIVYLRSMDDQTVRFHLGTSELSNSLEFELPLSSIVFANANARAGVYTVTRYCYACNSPAYSNTVALAGSAAYVGSCATNEFPLGSTIYVEGYGELFVNDRCGKDGVIDIYTEHSSGACECTGKEKAKAWIM